MDTMRPATMIGLRGLAGMAGLICLTWRLGWSDEFGDHVPNGCSDACGG